VTDELDLESRRLCPDGACIGVIGDDGRCGVCGRRAAPGAAAQAEPDAEAEIEAEADSETEDSFDEGRRLCPDEACIGVIGDDGRCKVCGTRAGS
jgi:hypothetical protein